MQRRGKIIPAAILITAIALAGCSNNSMPDPDDYIKLGQYKGLKVERSSYEVTEDAMQEELYMLANAYADKD